jgi:hypothetical protein
VVKSDFYNPSRLLFKEEIPWMFTHPGYFFYLVTIPASYPTVNRFPAFLVPLTTPVYK